MVVQVPENMKYVLDRGNYEYSMAINNIAFLISQHIEDENADFLDTALFDKMQDKLLTKAIQRWMYNTGVLINLLGEDLPRNIYFRKDNTQIEIQE